MKSIRTWYAVGLVVMCSLAAVWFLLNFDTEPYEVRGGPKREALRNPFLAAEKLLRGLGYPIETVQEAAYLERLPAEGALILSGNRQYHLTPARTEALFAWVESGGYLLADAGAVGPSDPILMKFDVRLHPRKRVATPAEPEQADERSEEKPAAAAARTKAVREPTRRAVSIPGYGRELRMRANVGRQLYVGEIDPAWGVKGGRNKQDNEGMELLDFRLGKGSVTLINGLWRFDNRGIEQDNHAELLAALLATHQPAGEVRIMTRLSVPSIWEWLSDHAQAAVLSALALLAAWLWRIIPRFGVIRPDPVAERRSLIEHLQAIGRFLWRKRSLDVLLDAARSNLHARLALRLSASGEPLHADLARHSGIGVGDIAFALTGIPQSPAQYTAAFRTLRELEHKLK
jgi:hypothetical protein